MGSIDLDFPLMISELTLHTGGGGGGTRYIKKVGMLVENFEIDP